MVDINPPLEISKLSALVDRADADELWRELDLQWSTGKFNSQARLVPMLAEAEFIENSELGPVMNRRGVLFASRLLLPVHELLRTGGEKRQVGSYTLQDLISTGKNSTIYSAEHVILGSKVIVKILRPGASQDIVKALRHLGAADIHPAVVKPIDFTTVWVNEPLRVCRRLEFNSYAAMGLVSRAA